LLEGFECGSEPYEQEVANWIEDWIWKKSLLQQRERTVLGLDRDADEAVVGYGTWEHVEVFGTEPADTHIEIAWFGIASTYKGAVDSAGAKASELLYATLEAAALAHADSNDEMPFTLTCHVDNLRGRRFWERQHYQLVGPPYAEVEKNRYHRMVR
jgi:hypothetical protein